MFIGAKTWYRIQRDQVDYNTKSRLKITNTYFFVNFINNTNNKFISHVISDTNKQHQLKQYYNSVAWARWHLYHYNAAVKRWFVSKAFFVKYKSIINLTFKTRGNSHKNRTWSCFAHLYPAWTNTTLWKVKTTVC